MTRAAFTTGILVLCVLLPMPALSEDVTRYESLTQLFNAEGEFTEEIGTLGPCSNEKLSC